MAVTYEKLVAEDFNLGTGTVDVTMPAGGTATGTKINIGTFLGATFNVRSAGAVGDGSANDTAALQTAIDDASAVSGTVIVPAGRYVVIGALNLKSNITWMGLSRTGSIIDLNGATAVVNSTDQNDVHVRDLTFEKLNMQVNMLSICASASVAQQKRNSVKNCRFITSGATPDGNTASIGVYGPTSNVNPALNTLDVEILDNYIQFSHIGVLVKYGATRASVRLNRMIQVGTDATAEGAKFEQVTNGLFSQNTIVMGAAALSALTVQDGTTGSRIEGNLLDILLGCTYGLRGEYGGFAYATDNEFVRNTILGSGSNVGIYSGYHGLTGWTIEGNRLKACGYNWLGDSTRWRDNRVTGVTPSTLMLFPGTLGEYEQVFEVGTLANDAVGSVMVATVTTTLAGMLQVEYLSNAGAYKVGLYIVNGSVLNVSVPSTMDDTADNASTLNVYVTGGFLKVQNKLGATATDIVLRFRGRNSN